MGAETRLIRFAEGARGLAIEADRDRFLTLLSVAVRRPVRPSLVRHVEAASSYWQHGDKSLANLRLVFAGLPRLNEPADADRLRAAEYLLDEGMSPRVLLTELGLDPTVLDVAKFSSDQPRVPAGSGRASGRWTGESGGNDYGSFAPSATETSGARGVVHRPTPIIVPVAADRPLKPGGIEVVPLTGATRSIRGG